MKEDKKGIRESFVMRRLKKLCLFLMIFLLSLATAYGAEYPSKTIQIVSPFPPGGQTDMIARFLNKKLSTLLGQPVVVVNRGGGGGTVGIQSVATAPADGYTILSSTPSISVSPLVVKSLPFSLKDFTPINLASSMPSMISVHKSAPWRTLEEFIADARKHPGKFSYSSPGTLGHISGELFKMNTGTDITHIPMDGAAKVTTSVLGGHITMTFLAYGSVKSYLEAGSLRALGVMAKSRLEEFPDIPTTVERGYPKVVIGTWQAFFVPSKTPPAIVKRLGEVFSEALKDKEIIGMLKNAGFKVENLNTEETARYLAEEQEKLSEVIKVGKIGQ